MKLLPHQKDAYKEFKKTGYIFIDAFRRSGKTELLRYIISKSEITDIGIFCPTFQMFNYLYKDLFTPFDFFLRANPYMNFDKRILICDEYFIAPTEGKKIACAITGVSTTKWKINKKTLLFDFKELKGIKKVLSKELYDLQFGNYEK